MRRIVSIFVIICALLALIPHYFYIGQFVVLAVIARPCAWSYFFAFGWLSMLVFLLTIVQVMLSDIYGKQR